MLTYTIYEVFHTQGDNYCVMMPKNELIKLGTIMFAEAQKAMANNQGEAAFEYLSLVKQIDKLIGGEK